MTRPPRYSPATQALLERFASAASQWFHGYTLMKELDLPSGTLYPVLMRLAELGWLETTWEPPGRPGRPPRHLYRLAPPAATEVRALLSAWRNRGVQVAVPRPVT